MPMDRYSEGRLGPFEQGAWLTFPQGFTDLRGAHFPAGSRWALLINQYFPYRGELIVRLWDPERREHECVVSLGDPAPRELSPVLYQRLVPTLPAFQRFLTLLDAAPAPAPAPPAVIEPVAPELDPVDRHDPGQAAWEYEQLGDQYAKSDPARARWFYDQALDAMRAYASYATSGGEGTARMYEYAQLEKRLGPRSRS